MPDRDVETMLAEWLAEEAPTHAPDRILVAANERMSGARQRRRGRLAWLARRPLQSRGGVGAATATVAVIVLVSLALYAGSAPPINVTSSPTDPAVAASPPQATPPESPPPVTPPPATTTPATPSQMPEPTIPASQGVAGARTVVCGNVTIHDETKLFEERGIVSSCTATSELPPGVSIEDFDGMTLVVNPPDDQRRLHAVWIASPCDRRAELSIRASASDDISPLGEQTSPGYELAVYLPDAYAGCRAAIVPMGVLMELSEPVPADLITSSQGTANAAEDRITDITLDATSHDAGATYHLGGIYSISSSVTSTGQWAMCGIEIAAIDVTRDYDRGVLLLGFGGLVTDPPRAINDRTTVIPQASYRLRAPSLPPGVNDSRLPPCEGWSIAIHALTQASWDDTDSGDDDNFGLKLEAAQTEFALGQPIDIGGTLTYQSPLGETIIAVGSGSGLVSFGIEQLDGELEMGSPQTDDCQHYSLDGGVPLEIPISMSSFGEPDLRLPAGVWRVFAFAGFAVGECGGKPVELTASITIRVR